jgi:methylated-DNA-[protein]-cysteine S-methyltransferase
MRTLLRRHYGHAEPRPGRVPAAIGDALRAYFDGEVEAITRLAARTNGSVFQRRVWDALRAIPAGRTWTYGELAGTIGRPSASRAVGLANGANPVAIVVPCHRVIGANGNLTGYGGGLERKRWLLEHEQRALQGAGRISA